LTRIKQASISVSEETNTSTDYKIVMQEEDLKMTECVYCGDRKLEDRHEVCKDCWNKVQSMGFKAQDIEDWFSDRVMAENTEIEEILELASKLSDKITEQVYLRE